MELVIYLSLILLISIGIFWLVGQVVCAFKKPAVLFPPSLAVKMAVGGVIGSLAFMIGGLALSTLLYNNAMSKRADFEAWSSSAQGLCISIISLIGVFFSGFYLAFWVFE